MTDDFSLPFCQLKLQILFHKDSAKEDRNRIVDAMFKTAVADSRARKFHWVNLVTLMSPDAIRQLRELAEREFFFIPLPEESALEDPATSHPPSLETAQLYLTIIERLAYSIPNTGAPSIVSILVEKMDALLQKVITAQNGANNSTENWTSLASNQSRPKFERALAFWFSALLRMVVIHRASFVQPSPTLKPGPSHEQTRLLISIFCIALSRLPGDVLRLFPTADDFLARPNIQEESHSTQGILQTHALDVAASLIDIFPDEAQQQCARFLKEKCPPFMALQNDARFLYLLGPMTDSVSSFSVPQPVTTPSPAASASTPTPSSANHPAPNSSAPVSSTALSTGFLEDSNSMANRLRLQQRGRIVGPYPIRPWELLEDAAPFVGVNDTAVNLGYFDARRVRN